MVGAALYSTELQKCQWRTFILRTLKPYELLRLSSPPQKAQIGTSITITDMSEIHRFSLLSAYLGSEIYGITNTELNDTVGMTPEKNNE
jgi:hypothetical protein